MYKLMLVDDESEIREGLQEVVDFEKYGFTVVGEAANGLEALNSCERLAPDLIITDIRMPLMDGLTMCKRIHAVLPTARFIILSGYDDFDYAREAISINCLGYLLKPISAAEFVEMLGDARQKLDEEFAQRQDMTRLREHFRSSLPLLREMLLASLLSGGITGEEALAAARKYEMNLSAAGYELALLRLSMKTNEAAGIDDEELLNFAVMNMAQEIMIEHDVRAYFFHYHGYLAVLSPLAQEAAFDTVLECLDEARKTVDYYLNIKVTIGIGLYCTTLDQLPACGRQAQFALEQCTILDGQDLLCARDLERGQTQRFSIDEALLRQLGNALKVGNVEKTDEVLDILMEHCRKQQFTPRLYRDYLMEIYGVLVRASRDMLWNMGEEGDEDTLSRLMECPPPEEASVVLRTLCKRYTQHQREGRAYGTHVLVQQAIEYLNANYADEEMSVEKLCRHLHISASYFSVVFKKETKQTIVQYLTRLRMDKAMALLGSTAMKTAQIAQSVGIPDPSYFSYAFKKHFGMSPSQVRKGREASV